MTQQIEGEQAEHTKGKWCVEVDHIVARDERGGCTPNDRNSVAKVFGPDREANAAFIVLACNSFYQMRDALEGMVGRFAADMEWALEDLPLAKAIENARAALLKAKGESK